MADKARVYIGGGLYLVAEAGGDPSYKEIYIGLEDESGAWLQDLACAGQEYSYGAERLPHGKDTLRVLVREDPGRDDYTRGTAGIPLNRHAMEALVKTVPGD